MKLQDIEIGKRYRIIGTSSLCHCLTIGAECTVVKIENGDIQMLHRNHKTIAGAVAEMYQWVSPEDLGPLKVPRETKWKKELFRADGALYLVRYTLLWTKWLKIRIHHILLSDTECLHDHPWNFISIILKGGYTEEMPYKATFHAPNGIMEPVKYKKWYGPGSIVVRKAEDQHRLILNWDIEKCEPTACWTLVFMFKRRREWGFWKRGKFVPHADYKMTQNCE